MHKKEKMLKFNFKKVFACLFALVLCMNCMVVHADDGGYTITDYDVQATYKKNNTIDVKEVIHVNFSNDRHGIYRNIPLSMYINADEKYKLAVKNISVLNDEYEIDKEDGNQVIQIGDPDSTLIGPHTYTIRYTLVIPEDYHSDFDFLYYSVLGSNWQTSIQHFSFDIQFEKALTQKEMTHLQIYSGSLGNQSNDLQVETHLSQNQITGQAYNIGPNQAITIYGKLDANYFEGAKKVSAWPTYIFLGLAILFGLYSLFRAFYLKKSHITPVITFYPPKGMDPAYVGCIVDESADTEDLMALIPYWASLGYLRIEETQDDLVLHKIKDLESSAKKYQTMIFNALFKKKEDVKLSKLSKNFGKTMEKAQEALHDEFTKDKKLSTIDHGFVTCIVSIVCIVLCIFFNSKYSVLDTLIVTILSAFTFVMLYLLSFKKETSNLFSKNKLTILRFGLDIALLCILIFFVYRKSQSITSILNFETLFIGILCTGLPILLSSRFSVMSSYFKEVAPELLGFKDFIEKAELDQLEKLSLENPEYYYDVIPYAMVFGLSDTWTQKFSTLSIVKPDWYDPYDSDPYTSYFYYQMLTRRMYEPIHQNIMDYQTAQMKSTADSLGSSFGGFSGGGAGGGGGGSW